MSSVFKDFKPILDKKVVAIKSIVDETPNGKWICYTVIFFDDEETYIQILHKNPRAYIKYIHSEQDIEIIQGKKKWFNLRNNDAEQIIDVRDYE